MFQVPHKRTTKCEHCMQQNLLKFVEETMTFQDKHKAGEYSQTQYSKDKGTLNTEGERGDLNQQDAGRNKFHERNKLMKKN